MRKESPNDFVVQLPGVGDFRFARPTIGDQMQIDREFDILTNGGTSNVRLSVMASMSAIHKTTCVGCPPGWENIEVLDVTQDENVSALLIAYREKEDSFRQVGKKNGKTSGAGTVEEAAVLVPPEVQPSAN